MAFPKRSPSAMLRFLLLSGLMFNVAAPCADWLKTIKYEKTIIPEAGYFNGNMTGEDINYICGVAPPIGCCNNNGYSLNHAAKFQLSAWTWTCSTLVAASQVSLDEGEKRAALCWNSKFTEACEDYDAILYVECGLGPGKGPGGEGVSAIASWNFIQTTSSTASPTSRTTLPTNNATRPTSSRTPSPTPEDTEDHFLSPSRPNPVTVAVATSTSIGGFFIIVLIILLCYRSRRKARERLVQTSSTNPDPPPAYTGKKDETVTAPPPPYQP